MKVVCPSCGYKNSINPLKVSKDKLCTNCRAVISKAGKRPNPTWTMEKERQGENRAKLRAGGRRQNPKKPTTKRARGFGFKRSTPTSP